MSIRVVLSFGNALFSAGISKLLEDERDIAVEILPVDTKCTLDKLESLHPDAILVDFITLFNVFSKTENAKRRIPLILLDTNCGKDNLMSAVMRKKISGVLSEGSSPALMKKAIRAVANGELWLDKQMFKELLYGMDALSNKKMSMLSGREREISALIGNGFRNKEIAQKLNISESTVKSHLNRIFQKLHVRTRSELVGYAIKNNDLNGTFNFFSLP